MLKRRKRMLLYITIPGILLIVMFVFVPLLNGGMIMVIVRNNYCGRFFV